MGAQVVADETVLEGQQPSTGAAETILDGSANASSTPAGYQPLPPALIAQGYRAVRVLGSGAEAQVWLCTNGSGRGVAVKVHFRPPTYAFAFNSAEYRRHFSPDWTVEVIERGSDQFSGTELHYEVMEYCQHGTLEDFLAGRGVPEEKATLILRRLTWCIKSLQGPQGKVVHGDIKPRNILVRSTDPIELVLTDFGLTVDLGGRSHLTNLGKGTTPYSAPEIMRIKGAPADWWSLGMVLYTALVGRGYYQIGDDRWADQRTIERDLISHDISLSALDGVDMPDVRRTRWRMLLAGLLTRDPEQRWGAEQVESWLDGGHPQLFRQIETEDRPGPESTGPRVEPFAFAGVGEFSSPEALGEALAAQPRDAARLISGKGTDRLIAWLREDARTGDDYSELRQHDWDPDAKVAYFIGRLAPRTPLTFRAQPIGTPADLRRLAQNGDIDVIEALYQAELLGSIAADGARSGYRMIEANWRDLVERAAEAARERGITMPAEALLHIRRWALLLAASDSTVTDKYVDDVRARVNSQEMSAASEVDWFLTLRKDAGLGPRPIKGKR